MDRGEVEMKKVGLVICYFHKNYGSMLQAYATQHVFDKMGIPNEAVYCQNPHMYMTMPKVSYYLHKLTNKDVLLDKINRTRGKMVHRMLKTDFYSMQTQRNEKFKEFSESVFRVSRPYADRKELMKDTENYSAFVVGSDQLWSPANIDNDFYTLTFVPDHIPKIAYATSFGTASLPKYQHRRARKFLNRFNYISVREETGKKLVESLSDKKAQVVLDPTLLLKKDDWDIFSGHVPVIKGSYIFCYFLGNNRNGRKFAKELKENTGYQIVALLHMDEYISEDEDFADITPYEIGPIEFVNLVKNAAFVCTDSFHGTVFSIIYGKKFFTFNRFNKSSSISTNTRIDTLLGMLSLENRRKKGYEDVLESMQSEIDYESVYEKLRRKRTEAFSYLERALDGIKE